jgi:hypothetical protein
MRAFVQKSKSVLKTYGSSQAEVEELFGEFHKIVTGEVPVSNGNVPSCLYFPVFRHTRFVSNAQRLRGTPCAPRLPGTANPSRPKELNDLAQPEWDFRMMSSSTQPIALTREYDAIEIPSGTRKTLSSGARGGSCSQLVAVIPSSPRLVLCIASRPRMPMRSGYPRRPPDSLFQLMS